MIIDTWNYRIDLNSLVSTVITDTYRGIYSRLDRTCGCDAAVWAISYAVNYDSLCGKLDLGMRYFAESSHGFLGGEKCEFSSRRRKKIAILSYKGKDR